MMFARLTHRLGRRGLTLLLLGVAWVVMGLGRITTVPPLHPQQVPHEHLPYPLLGSMWIAFGIIAILVGFRARKANDTFGFLAASTMPMLYVVSYGVSFVTWVATGGAQGMDFAILGFAVWAAVVMLITVLASWPEPPSPIGPPDGVER